MSSPEPMPNAFGQSLEQLRLLKYRSEFKMREAPAPARLAPFGYAQTVDISLGDDTVGSGRLVILHDPAGQPSWEGTTRIIAFVEADVDLEVAADPLLTEVGWSWLLEALEGAGAHAEAVGGTVTQTTSRSFGVMDEREPEGRLQIRASWTPKDADDLGAHARAWALLTASACGLPPTSNDLASRRN